MKLNKFLIGALFIGLSSIVLAEDKPINELSRTSSLSTTYTIKAGYKHFRIKCIEYNAVYAKEYTLSNDKKEFIMITDDGEWVQFVNAGCKITMVKS